MNNVNKIIFYDVPKSLKCKYSSYYTGPEKDRGGTVVKALCYKSEGRWFDSR